METRYDYNTKILYKEIDDINYGYIDQNNLKRFFIKNGTAPKEALLLAVIRRFDLDADAKLKVDEFCSGIKSQDGFSKRALKSNSTLSGMHGKTGGSSMMDATNTKSSFKARSSYNASGIKSARKSSRL